MDIISSQAIFLMFPVEILLYENKHSIIIYSTDELHNDDKNIEVKTHVLEMLAAPKPEVKKLHIYILLIL